MGLLKTFTKRKTKDKGDRLEKKAKLVITMSVKETPLPTKVPPYSPSRSWERLNASKCPIAEQRPPLLCEDSRYARRQFSSIIKDEDYEDLGNHTTEAMGETTLFSLV